MIQRQLKLRLTPAQAKHLETWLFQLTGGWNWAIRKIEQDANDGIYYSQKAFHNRLADHGKKLGIPSHTLQGMLDTAWRAWQRGYKKLAKKPKRKGKRNRLSSMPLPDAFKRPTGTRIHVPGIGSVRFHKHALPAGRLQSGRIVKRASGWYLCLCIDTQPHSIPAVGPGAIGIDPGFLDLLTLSTGEKMAHPHERRQTAQRLAQAQRGSRKQLTARLQERLANQRQDRNHKLSRRLVAENAIIVWSKDAHRGIAKSFGKSVASASHAQLRGMLAYKCTASDRQFLEVPSQHSTRTCSACRALTGPTGFAGLSVRQWTCPDCGAEHDRDVNAAMNTLIAGVGITLEHRRKAVPGIPCLEAWGGSKQLLGGQRRSRLGLLRGPALDGVVSI